MRMPVLFALSLMLLTSAANARNHRDHGARSAAGSGSGARHSHGGKDFELKTLPPLPPSKPSPGSAAAFKMPGATLPGQNSLKDYGKSSQRGSAQLPAMRLAHGGGEHRKHGHNAGGFASHKHRKGDIFAKA